MREIKFRAFDKLGRFDMAEVIFIDLNEKYVVTTESWNEDPETGEADCVANFDEIELMQYTGLKDKNGLEIYEGDIVKTDYCEYRDKICQVVWKNVGFVLMEKGVTSDYDSHDLYADGVEIIGNIYENPDLLSTKEGTGGE